MIGHLKISDGKMMLYGERKVMVPPETFDSVSEIIFNNKKLIPGFYETLRKKFRDGWVLQVKKLYGIEHQKFLELLIDTAEMGGWGKIELAKFDEKERSGTFIIYNSIATCKIKKSEPVDHIWRGLAAGGLSSVFEEDIDMLETKCVAMGDSYCEFPFKPREEMKKFRHKYVKSQLPY